MKENRISPLEEKSVQLQIEYLKLAKIHHRKELANILSDLIDEKLNSDRWDLTWIQGDEVFKEVFRVLERNHYFRNSLESVRDQFREGYNPSLAERTPWYGDQQELVLFIYLLRKHKFIKRVGDIHLAIEKHFVDEFLNPYDNYDLRKSLNNIKAKDKKQKTEITKIIASLLPLIEGA